MHNLLRWPDYRPFQKSENVWSSTCQFFDLWLWKRYTRNYNPSSFCTFLRNFNLIPREKVMTIFPRSPVLNVIQESAKRQLPQIISPKISREKLWNSDPRFSAISFQMGFFCDFWNVTEKSYSENAMMTCLEQRNPRIQSSDTKCYETSSRKDRKDKIHTLQFRLFEGETSFTLHKWTILGWFKWKNLLSIYRSLRSHNIIQPT